MDKALRGVFLLFLGMFTILVGSVFSGMVLALLHVPHPVQVGTAIFITLVVFGVGDSVRKRTAVPQVVQEPQVPAFPEMNVIREF